jgi:hypothetical protein
VVRTALNDIVLHQGAMARIVDCDAQIDDAFVASYRADGLIVVDADRLDRLQHGGWRADRHPGRSRP